MIWGYFWGQHRLHYTVNQLIFGESMSMSIYHGKHSHFAKVAETREIASLVAPVRSDDIIL